ncbi:MAG: carboxypeptidase-like regulatory domain-containing protein, partial [Saprospiraceae bacterium]
MRILFLLFFFSCFVSLSAQHLQINEQPLSQVLNQLETDYNYLFSYRETDIQDVKITANLPIQNAKQLFNTLFTNTNLQYKIIANNYVLISKKTASETDDPPVQLPLLSGQILDSLTGQPLTYANVFVKSTAVGTYTDLNGKFQLRYAFSEQDSLVFSYVGYAEQRFKATDFAQAKSPPIFLNYLDLDDNFIVVTDYLTDGIQLRDNNAYNSLQPDKIGSLPGQAEPDVLQTIQFLPGISSPDGTAAGLNVRGGAADQNLLLWEDIPIYHAAHYFGMISALNPYIIDEAQIYRGGFSANYGGRISSVINLESNHYATDKNKFGVGTNFLNAYTYGKIKSANQRLTLSYSLRHSINGLWQSPTFNSITRRIQQSVLFDIPIFSKLPPGYQVSTDFRFLDGHFSADYQISDRSEISVAALIG